jgi:hypothetical protein
LLQSAELATDAHHMIAVSDTFTLDKAKREKAVDETPETDMF